MGKRARKTRWRALDIADEHSDSEESNTTSSAVSSRNSRSYSNAYNSKFSYSSQSTPARRRYNQYDGSAKSTRSSSTASENKITFNEDEYTRITTPRQDVLFKKGYLNKPKNYQTQTSTGTSTVSTGNSTENGTPDHQSTDLDYESQFMFPNGFVDQNGIYYVNSYEPYPLMLFNPPTYYHECSNIKSKRMSTGSLSESMSPTNEEATSQDLSPSGGDASNSVSDYSGGPPVYNMVFPGYYVNGACTPTGLATGHQFPQEPVKKLRKRRERKSSKNIQEDSSENTDDNSCDESSESVSHHPAISPANKAPADSLPTDVHLTDSASRLEAPTTPQTEQECPRNESQASESKEELKTACENSNHSNNTLSNGCAETKTELNDENPDFDLAQPVSDYRKSSVLKPDAEEFVPRSYISLGPHQHIKMLPPNFLPIPLVPINDFGGQNFAPHPAFIPPGIPINFIPHHPGQKIFPPGPGFVNFAPPMIHEAKIEETADNNEEIVDEQQETQDIATPSHTPIIEESKPLAHSKSIDIATVVSKLEAVKQQETEEEATKEDDSPEVVNETKPFVGSPRFKKPTVYKRNYYNKYRSSPVHSGDASSQIKNGYNSPQIHDSPHRQLTNSSVYNGTVSPHKQINGSTNHRNSPVRYTELSQPAHNGYTDSSQHRNSPVRHVEVLPSVQKSHSSSLVHRNEPLNHFEAPRALHNGHTANKLVENGINQANNPPVGNTVYLPKSDDYKLIRNSPERLQKSWKPQYQNNYQNYNVSPKRAYNSQNSSKSIARGLEKPIVNGVLSPTLHKNYSESSKKAPFISATSSAQSKKHINVEKPVKAGEDLADVTLKWELLKLKPNQWISVSSRKKKKNKNTDDVDLDADSDVLNEPAQSDTVSSDFEIYDVSQFVDVIPPLVLAQNIKQEKKIEDMLNIIAQNEPLEVLANGQQTPTDIKIPEVSDIEKDIIVKIEEQKETSPVKIHTEIAISNSQIEENAEIANVKEIVPQIHEDQEEETIKPKRKSKKGTQKPLTKKVIITDIDLSMTITEVKPHVKKIVTKVEEVSSVKSQPKVPVVNVTEEISIAEEIATEVVPEQTEKKTKKKKKNKTPKSIENESLPESNAALNTSGDSHEFHIENSLLSESLEKTNDDISLELEKLIQKGMYNSLQEKIKSINVEPTADGFFKNFHAASSSGKDNATTANGFMKTPDFNRIFQSTRQFMKPNMVSLEKDKSDNKVAVDDIHYKDTKTSSSDPDAANSSSGLFLDHPEEVQEVPKIQEAPTEVTIEPKVPAEENEDQEDNKKLYPITQAVKEWMSKTREATPEVEILKSPSTIQREFGENGSLDCGLNDPLDSDEEDEVTLFSTDDILSQEQPDLLDYWENEVANSETVSKHCENPKDGISNHSNVCSDSKSCTKCLSDNIKGEEEEIEVYESKYGHNDAFVELQKELKEKSANVSCPKSFPNRTVCCSLQ